MANITNVTCTLAQSALTVTVAWDTTETGTLTIYDAASIAVAGTVTSSGPGFTIWQPANTAMISGQPYWAQVVVQQVQSVKVPLLWAPATNVASAYDGHALAVSWTAAAGRPTAGNYNVTLTSGSQVQTVQSPGTSVTFVPVTAFNMANSWTLAVVPTLGVSTGPAAAGTVVTTAVAVAAIACTATGGSTGQLAITPAANSFTAFVATLTQNGTTVLSQTLNYTAPTAMVLPITAANWPLSQLGGYAIVLQPVAGNATGPRGGALPVVATAPVITLAAVSAVNSPSVAITLTLPPGAPASTGFTASLSNGTKVVGSGTFVGSTGTVAISETLSDATYVLTVAGTAGASSTGPTATATLLTTAPTVSAIDNSAGLLTTTFVAAVGSYTTQIDVIVSGTIVATGRNRTSIMRLPAPANGVSFEIGLRAVAPGLLGPVLGPVAMLCEAPVAQGVAFTLAGAATVTWRTLAAPPASDGYLIESYDGALVTGSTPVTGGGTASGAFPAAGQTVGAGASATVRATLTDLATHAVLTGPRSAHVPVLVNAPGPIQGGYDGATARIGWTAPAGDQVDGYLVTLTDATGGVAPATRRVADTTLTLAYAAAAASTVTIAVQATGGNAIGPAATAPLFSAGLFPSTDTAKAAYLAPSASLAFGKQPLAILLPEILGQPGSSLPSNASFTLATTATAPWSYLLTVKESDAVWGFDASPIRAPLLTDVTDFMAQLTAQGLTPRGDLLLRQAIARVLPLTFIETLFYGYGFNAADGGAGQGQGLIDITPGMVLRVELEAYQSLPTSLPTGNAGMVGATTFDYDVGGYGTGQNWRQGFDAFVSRLVGHGMAVPPPTRSSTAPIQSGSAGSPDFYYPNFLQPCYRLIFPPTFLPSTDNAVSNNLRSNVALIGAATRAELDTATTMLRDSSGNYQPVNAVYFRGRSLISPRIHVLLNGGDITVPLGTSVANLLERFAGLAAAGGREAQLRVHRGLSGVAIQGWVPSLAVPVRLDWTGGWASIDGTSWMDLPLLHGDRVDVELG